MKRRKTLCLSSKWKAGIRRQLARRCQCLFGILALTWTLRKKKEVTVFGDVHRSCFNWPDNLLPFPKGRQDFICSLFSFPPPHFSIMPLCFVSLQGALNWRVSRKPSSPNCAFTVHLCCLHAFRALATHCGKRTHGSEKTEGVTKKICG